MQIFEGYRKLFSKKMKQNIEFTITELSNVKPNKQGTKVQISIPIDSD